MTVSPLAYSARPTGLMPFVGALGQSLRNAGSKLPIVLGLVLALTACKTGNSGPVSGSAAGSAVELHVLTSGGFTAAFNALSEEYEAQSKAEIMTAYGPSMGETANAIPARLNRREPADVVILARGALDKLAEQGLVLPGSQIDLGLSRIAIAVREGAPVPDISTPEAIAKALLGARSVAWSDSASGVYVQTVLLDRLGVAEEVKRKGRMIPATPVGEIVARGEAEIGFQQLSELKPVKGIHIVGLLPESLQKVTAFSAGVVSYSAHQDDARALIAYLSSKKAYPTITLSGLQPAAQEANP